MITIKEYEDDLKVLTAFVRVAQKNILDKQRNNVVNVGDFSAIFDLSPQQIANQLGTGLYQIKYILDELKNLREMIKSFNEEKIKEGILRVDALNDHSNHIKLHKPNLGPYTHDNPLHCVDCGKVPEEVFGGKKFQDWSEEECKGK